VCLHRALDPDYVMAMAPPIERALVAPETSDMSAMRSDLADAGIAVLEAEGPEVGSFMSGLDHWVSDPDFKRFACESDLPRLVRSLLKSLSLYLYEDSVLVKEPGAALPTAFHNDMAYFHLAGDQIATTWVPLDRVDADSGAVIYVVGSHRWDGDYRPNYFISDEPIDGTLGESIPDMSGHETIHFDTEPGDVIVHHARTVHGASGNRSSRRRRALSIRYCGDDVRFQQRQGLPLKRHHEACTAGGPLAPPQFPKAGGSA
jgi:ectoine hydroxylase-related dioxygenase (phytanoyl-CoA dioxygenase family)